MIKAAKKKAFKSPNTYVIIFFILLVVAVLTWFVPGGMYQTNQAGQAIANTYSSVSANRQGLWDVIMAPIIGMVGNQKVTGAIMISLNVMLFGSFLEMMDQAGAITIALKRIAQKYQRNYFTLITLLTFIMGIFGTVQGAYEEGFVYLLMFLPVILALGLDTIVALMIVILGTQAGCAASIVNPFSTGIASGIAGISPGAGIIYRTIIFIVLMSLTSFLICHYAKRIRSHPEKSVQFYRRQEDLEKFSHGETVSEMNGKQKKVLGLFILTFLIMIVSLVPWTSLNPDWIWFEKITEGIKASTILSTLIGSDVVPFGSWYFNEINGLLIVMTFLSGIVMGYSIDQTLAIFIKGAGSLVSTAFIIPLARGIQVIMTNGNITATVLHMCEKTLGSFSPALFVLACFLVYLLLAVFIPSSTGLAAATMSIMAPLAIFAGVSESSMVVIYNMSLGLVKMFAPTSIIVMTCIQAAQVDYGSWLKATGKYIGLLFLVCCAILLVGIVVLK